MSTAEGILELSRRDLITTLFPRKKGRHTIRFVSPNKRGPSSSPSHPQPPERGGRRFTRRQIIAGLVIAGTAVAAEAAYLLEPWAWFSPPTPDVQPQALETLESLVNQAKQMEDEYKDKDLSNKPTREKYAGILAGIFAFHYPEYFSKQQLTQAITWTGSVDQFTRQRIASAGKTGTPTATQLENDLTTTAMTNNRTGIITVNTAANSFLQRNIDTTRTFPKEWNPLKTLRISLFHEFNHLVTESTDEIIFSIIDSNNQYKDKRIEGFRFVGIDGIGRYPTSFTDLHEAVIELLAKDISLAHFDSYLSDMPSETPELSMSVIMNNLEQIFQAIGLNRQELTKLHKSSNLRELLIILADKAGAPANTSLKDKISFGSRIVRIALVNDQPLLQAYLNLVRSLLNNQR